ncbi:ATP-binding protein [Actinoplanes sp. NPDC051851]|uniref:sensor histidine kinase n=1 Tax=Actinoplanes sp. NPDC051851 TaxID=3154753 RepID=UPI003412730A
MTVRLRLTLLYAVLFVLSGAVLSAITYLLVGESGSSAVISTRTSTPAGDETVTTHLGTTGEYLGTIGEAVDDQRAALMHALLVRSAVALAVTTVLAALLGWLVAGRVLRPLQTMTGTIRRISARNVHERLAAGGPRDELRELADTVDGLLGRLEAALGSHRRFVANAAHELRTPLTVGRALLEEAVIDPDATVDSFRAQFTELIAVGDQQTRLLESLLVLATSERGPDRRERVDLAAIARTHGASGEIAAASVVGDPALIERLVANLVDNARTYNVPSGTVRVSTGTDGGRAFLSVTNTGPVVPPELVDRIRQPFERLGRRADDRHHGLGLSIVQAIATAHGADLSITARPEGGLDVRVLFPASWPPPAPAAHEPVSRRSSVVRAERSGSC